MSKYLTITQIQNLCQTLWATQQQYLLADLQRRIHWYFRYVSTPWVHSETYLLILNSACSGSVDRNTIQLLQENRQRRYCWLQVILCIINFRWSSLKSFLFSPPKKCWVLEGNENTTVSNGSKTARDAHMQISSLHLFRYTTSFYSNCRQMVAFWERVILQPQAFYLWHLLNVELVS